MCRIGLVIVCLTLALMVSTIYAGRKRLCAKVGCSKPFHACVKKLDTDNKLKAFKLWDPDKKSRKKKFSCKLGCTFAEGVVKKGINLVKKYFLAAIDSEKLSKMSSSKRNKLFSELGCKRYICIGFGMNTKSPVTRLQSVTFRSCTSLRLVGRK